jgi:FKBP-type peptidyl-prolyl cis-trans isomerase
MVAIRGVLVVLVVVLVAVSGFGIGRGARRGEGVRLNHFSSLADAAGDSSSTRLFNVVPKTSAESMSSSMADAKKLVTAGAAVLAVQTLLPSASRAYGDAEELARKKKPTKEKVVVQETDLGIQYLISKKGTGPYPNPGDFVVINYTGFLSDGTVFDSTEGKGKKPLAFRMGEKQVIPGLESVIEMLQAGAEATCTIPAKYAYGSKGVCIKEGECLIPPNEKIRYAIKVKTVGAGYN